MIYYVDFDRTIFDTKSFLEELYEILEEYHIPKEVFIKKSYDVEEFNPYKILNLLKDEYQFTSNLFLDIDRLIEKAKAFLYYDALVFVRDVKKKGNKLILLTRGDNDFQNDKIDHTGLRNIFDKVIITNDDKGNLDIDYQGIFIDDKIEELESILKRNPYKVFLIDHEHKYDKVNNKNINLIHSLDEVEILEN